MIMYCIEKHIYYCSGRLTDVIREYFKCASSDSDSDYLDVKYINSEKGDEFLKFLENINFTPADNLTNKERLNDIRAILKFLSYKSKFMLKDMSLEEIRHWTFAAANRTIWTEFTDLQAIHSSLGQFLITKVKENPDFLGGQSLLYYWIMFEVQFRLTKAEKKIWEQGFDEFIQYVYGKLAILQAGN